MITIKQLRGKRNVNNNKNANYEKQTSNDEKKKTLKGKATFLHFQQKENQQKRMEEVYEKMKFSSLEEWLTISAKKFKINGGESLLVRHYKKDMKSLLSSLYPNFPWDFSNMKTKLKLLNTEEYREKMNFLFIKLQLNSLDDWLLVPSQTIYRNGGRQLLFTYQYQMKTLFSSLYPNYPWPWLSPQSISNSISISKSNSNSNSNSISISLSSDQKETMFLLFIKLQLKSLDDWLNVSINSIKENGGEKLINYYHGDLISLLSSVYPDHSFQKIHKKSKKDHINNINQLNNNNIINSNNINNLENFSSEKQIDIPNQKNFKSKLNFNSIEKQREFMDELFIKLNLNSLDDWLNIKRIKIKKNGGKRILKEYENKMNFLLSSIYPNHPWNFNKEKMGKRDKNLKLKKEQKKMDFYFVKLKLKTLDDWLSLSKSNLLFITHKLSRELEENSAGIQNENSNENVNFLIAILQRVYPNFPWEFSQQSSKTFFQSIENQKILLKKLFIKLNLKSNDDWQNISTRMIINNGGKELLKLYSNNTKKLFTSLYPNFIWRNPEERKKREKFILLLRKEQQKMDLYFVKFKLKTLDDWLSLSKSKLALLLNRGGIDLSLTNKNNNNNNNNNVNNNDEKNKEKLSIEILQRVYPHYPWPLSFYQSDNNNNNNNLMKNDNNSVNNDREFMDNLFIKFKLKSVDDWLNIKRIKIKENGGEGILKRYNNKMEILLQTIYPYHLWRFITPKKRKEEMSKTKLLSFHRKKFDLFFYKLKLKTIEEWISVSKKRIIKRGGNSIAHLFTVDQIVKSLERIYPNYPWNFIYNSPSKFPTWFIKSTENQKKIFDQLFFNLNLKSLDDWLTVNRLIIKRKGGKRILKKYGNKVKSLFLSIYPNFPWRFIDKKQKLEERNKTKLLSIHREKIDQMFIKFNLKSFDDWQLVTKTNLIRYGGKSMLLFYHLNLCEILERVYPHYPWDSSLFTSNNPKLYFESMENQREFMDGLFVKLKLKNLDDWFNIKKITIKKSGGGTLLKKYNYDMKTLLLSIYPNYLWDYKTIFASKIRGWMKQYYITQKKDWYRLPLLRLLPLFDILKFFYPSEKWEKFNFARRTKRATQRLLFSFSHQIYPSMLMYEDYRHPFLITLQNYSIYELDIFIPALQIAMEYQGEHHYDDIPGGFAGIELFQERDVEKEKLASSLHIKIIYIPYWWDLSLSSLQTSLQSQL